MSDDLIGHGELTSREVRAACYRTVVVATQMHRDDFPGLTEFVLDTVVMTVGRKGGRVLGSFAPDCWAAGATLFSEINLNLDRSRSGRGGSRAEDLLITLIHELAHVHAHFAGIQDTSNRGRYHSMRGFGRIAFALGLQVRQTGTYIGCETPGLNSEGRELYGDILRDLEDAIVLRPHRPAAHAPTGAQPGTSGASTTRTSGSPSSGDGRYVSAQCGCTVSGRRQRSVRVARGSWDLGPIICGVCHRVFESESLTTGGQDAKGGA